LYEDESFPERELAALVAAKVYYQLQEYNESMVFALGAGKLFNLDKPEEFEDTIVGAFARPFGVGRLGLSSTQECLKRVADVCLRNSKMCGHVHRDECHAKPFCANRHSKPTSTADNSISIQRQRKRQHGRQSHLAYHAILAVYSSFKVVAVSTRLLDTRSDAPRR